MMKPFFLKCHPDVQSSAVAKEVNLEALQSINGLMDTIQATCDGKLVDWPSTVEVEFLMTTTTESSRKKKRKQPDSMTSRRRVELVVPSKSLRDEILAGVDKSRATQQLGQRMQHELSKVLKVAGLPVPTSVWNTDHHLYDSDMYGGMWENEIADSDSSSSSRTNHGRRFVYPNSRPQTRYEKSREEFVKRIDPVKYRQMYEDAVRDMKADLMTEGKISKSRHRRQQVINHVLSRVRIDKDSAEIVDTVEQLVAIRRLSLLFEDNFDSLQMEEMGKMWEDMVIVLTDVRDYGTSASSLHRRRKRNEETGFKFSFGADEKVVVHLPIDFRDDELLEELNRNIWDFYSLLGDDMEDIFRKPSNQL